MDGNPGLMNEKEWLPTRPPGSFKINLLYQVMIFDSTPLLEFYNTVLLRKLVNVHNQF